MIQEMKFRVTGEQKIHCAGCEQRIGQALRRLRGVTDVRASAETQRVAVILDPAQVSPGAVQARLEQLGYVVQPEPDLGGAPLPTREASMRRLARERNLP